MDYIFDFDGTLVDSMQTYIEKMLEILDYYNISYDKDEMIKTITPMGGKKTSEYFASIGVTEKPEKIFKLMHSVMKDFYHNKVTLKDDVKICLEELKAKGNRLYVLTAGPHDLFEPALEREGILELFDQLWSIDDFGITKEHPELFLNVIMVS